MRPVSESVVTALGDVGSAGTTQRVAGQDSFFPFGDAARHVLISEEDIHHAATEILRG